MTYNFYQSQRWGSSTLVLFRILQIWPRAEKHIISQPEQKFNTKFTINTPIFNKTFCSAFQKSIWCRSISRFYYPSFYSSGPALCSSVERPGEIWGSAGAGLARTRGWGYPSHRAARSDCWIACSNVTVVARAVVATSLRYLVHLAPSSAVHYCFLWPTVLRFSRPLIFKGLKEISKFSHPHFLLIIRIWAGLFLLYIERVFCSSESVTVACKW